VQKLVVIEYVSLDGVVQAPGHENEDPNGGFAHGGWTAPFMTDHHRYNSNLFQTAGAFLLGRVTYQIWSRYWPTVTDPNDEVARALNSLPKYIASTTLTDPDWKPATVISHDLAAEVSHLKARAGKPIFVLGSSKLAHGLMNYDLVDEYQLWLHPVVLGEGKRLFPSGFSSSMQLVDTTTTASGLVLLTYEP
jgi:dihydrofolate reductase